MDILTLEILEECNPKELHDKEFYWINKYKPMSQKCTNDGKFDNIILYNQRKFNINNISEKYEERRMSFYV